MCKPDYDEAIKRMRDTPGHGDCFYCGMNRHYAINMGMPFCLHPNPKRAHWFGLPSIEPASENLVNREGFQTNQFLHGNDDRDKTPSAKGMTAFEFGMMLTEAGIRHGDRVPILLEFADGSTGPLYVSDLIIRRDRITIRTH